MSRIAEEKALKEYPNMSYPCDKPSPYEDTGFTGRLREAYEKGYDQAMKDFMEKAVEWLYKDFNVHPHDGHVVQYISEEYLDDIDGFAEQFKHYMEE